jgi:hypothetical protein
MNDNLRDQLQKRFDFEAWKEAPRGAAEVSTGGLIEVGSELGGWTARRVEPVKVPGARASYRSIWQQGASADALLRLDIVEAGSATAGRELLLELLGEFQAPQVQRMTNPPAGELAFSVPGDTMIVFSRDNVVAMVRNAGRRVEAVTDFARLVDSRLARAIGA